MSAEPKEATGAAAGAPSNEDYAHVAEFWRALRRFIRRTEEVSRKNGLTPQRYRLLVMIKGAADGEHATVTSLCEDLQLGQSTVTELVTRCEDAGLLSRETSERDARVVHLQLTAEGERRLRATVTALGVERRQLARLIEHFDG